MMKIFKSIFYFIFSCFLVQSVAFSTSLVTASESVFKKPCGSCGRSVASWEELTKLRDLISSFIEPMGKRVGGFPVKTQFKTENKSFLEVKRGAYQSIVLPLVHSLRLQEFLGVENLVKELEVNGKPEASDQGLIGIDLAPQFYKELFEAITQKIETTKLPKNCDAVCSFCYDSICGDCIPLRGALSCKCPEDVRACKACLAKLQKTSFRYQSVSLCPYCRNPVTQDPVSQNSLPRLRVPSGTNPSTSSSGSLSSSSGSSVFSFHPVSPGDSSSARPSSMRPSSMRPSSAGL